MYTDQAKRVIEIEIEGLTSLLDQIGPDFTKAVELIMSCPGRLIITGIGKSGLIGKKIAATLNSTGTPSGFLHPVEAMHGDLGLVDQRDIILAISYSGETSELNLLLPSLKERGIKIISITGNSDSSLAGFGDLVLTVNVPREACPLGLAPTASTTATLALGDALAVVLLNCKKFQESDFRRNHPGGSLGERLKVRVSEVMINLEASPVVPLASPLKDAITVLNQRNLGAVLITAGDDLAGIITDGDIRRLVSGGKNVAELTIEQVMTPDPKSITDDLLAADALSIMQRHEITILPIKNRRSRLVGILHLQDLLGKGEFRFLM